MFVKVVVNRNIYGAKNDGLDYIVPKEMEKEIEIGDRVLVTVRGSETFGFVIKKMKETEFECVPIKEIISKENFSLSDFKLAKYISHRYFASLYDSLNLFLNPEVKTKNITKPLKEKFIVLKSKFFKLIHKKDFKIKDFLSENKIKYSPKREKILLYFINNKERKILFKDTKEEINATLSDFDIFVNKGFLNIKEEIISLDFSKKVNEIESNLKLTKEQNLVLDKIIKGIQLEEYKEFLLYGVTGSGKTEIYIQSALNICKKGKKALILVPEIALTLQMAERFLKRFGSTISVFHSGLSNRERYEEWNAIKKGERNIIIGTRSSIFAPIKDLGLIIIDEEHDLSYISDQSPRYDTREVASFIAKEKNAIIIRGSATPLVSSMYFAKNGKIELLELSKRANKAKLPEIDVVDMRKNRSLFSPVLLDSLEKEKEKNKQSLLFVSRRGYSGSVICNNCGNIETCPNCSVNLSYHKESGVLKCHYCGYTKLFFGKCSNCKSNVNHFGIGTEKLEEELKNKINDISTIIFDKDNVTKEKGHDNILKKFIKEKIDVMIGTQMLVKGHHFYNVNLAGVITADNLISGETYNSPELAFQTLIQFTGRSGREEKGKAIIQTYNPDHYIIELVKKNDYLGFYNIELAIRDKLNYPPFCNMVSLMITSKSEKKIEKQMNVLYKLLNRYKDIYLNAFTKNNIHILNKKLKKDFELNNVKISKKEYNILCEKEKNRNKRFQIYMPQPYRVNKIDNMYRWKILIKCEYDNIFIKWLNKILDSFYKENGANVHVILNGKDN